MKILVLNLKEAKERRDYMKPQLDLIGVSYSFIDALSPKDLDKKFLNKNPKISDENKKKESEK
jgi:GR25 family glycosyltransferase involved in LPS biosynthesis